MITGFDEQTKPLTDKEREVFLPPIIQGLLAKIGREDAIREVRLSIRRQRMSKYHKNEELDLYFT